MQDRELQITNKSNHFPFLDKNRKTKNPVILTLQGFLFYSNRMHVPRMPEKEQSQLLQDFTSLHHTSSRPFPNDAPK